ncbi:hypothetical protein JL720_13609 [Aureococcus anophagefferens]|nr:hypothetical protein JL720_13609 [Aureococcus anophagefferens]
MGLLKVALLACTASALAPQRRKSGVRVKAAQKVAGNVLAASSFLGLVIAQPAYASIESAAVNVADSAYPIIEKLQKKDVAPVVAKAADEALISTDPAKLVAVLKAVDVALVDALKTNGVVPPLKDVGASPRPRRAATTDKAKIKEASGALVAAGNTANKLEVVAVLADGAKLAKTINPADATAATGAVLELLKEVGAQ